MQIFAVGLDLEAMSLAALHHFTRARLAAEQAEQVRAGAHGGAVFLHQVAGFAAELREGLLAERDQILEIFFVGVAARDLGQLHLFEVGGFVARVAQRERSRPASRR